jgi:hypothetical protein
MALAPVVPRLRSFGFPITAAGIAVSRLPDFVLQRLSAAVHAENATDDQYNREETEDQDVEHGLLDHLRTRVRELTDVRR